MPRHTPQPPTTPLKDVKGLGPRSVTWLADAGITTLQQLETLGAVEAYRRVKAAHPNTVTLNMLWGLQAVLLDISWQQVPPELKEDLRRQLEEQPRSPRRRPRQRVVE